MYRDGAMRGSTGTGNEPGQAGTPGAEVDPYSPHPTDDGKHWLCWASLIHKQTGAICGDHDCPTHTSFHQAVTGSDGDRPRLAGSTQCLATELCPFCAC
jgi:hypothetical protein